MVGLVRIGLLPSSAPAPTPAKLGWDSLNITTEWNHHPPTHPLTTHPQRKARNLSNCSHCSWLVQNLFMTCSWNVHTCSPLVHDLKLFMLVNDLSTPCLKLGFDLLTACSLLDHDLFWLVHELSMKCSWLVYDLFMTCSWLI